MLLVFLPRLPGEKGTVSENRSQVSFRRSFVFDMRQAIWLYTKVFRHSRTSGTTTRMGNFAQEQSFKEHRGTLGNLRHDQGL